MMDSFVSDSITLLNAQLGFLDTHVAIIHIPLEVYPLFVQPLLQLILHNDHLDDDGSPVEPSRPWNYWHPFVNISITPYECSVVCPWAQAETLFVPVIARLNPAIRSTVIIRPDQYLVIMIGGPGVEAGARVLDLSAPLAMAGIPIFFITSYYSDFILVPRPARTRVIRALEARGFVFEPDDTPAGEAGYMTNPSSPLSQPRSVFYPHGGSGPALPSLADLQAKTFALLTQHGIAPIVHRHIDLVTCGGYKDITTSTSATNFTAGKLQLGLARCLTSGPSTPEGPNFFSLTLTDADSLSVTLEPRLIATLFHNAGEHLLLGKDGPRQLPLTFDLRSLPLESTGIVCGVAARLTDGMRARAAQSADTSSALSNGHSSDVDAFNISYLSTARAGHVIVFRDEIEDVVAALEGLGGGVVQNGVFGNGYGEKKG